MTLGDWMERHGEHLTTTERERLRTIFRDKDDEIERLRDEAERLRTRIANDAVRMRGMADCASGEL
jgi:hypothetical protein